MKYSIAFLAVSFLFSCGDQNKQKFLPASTFDSNVIRINPEDRRSFVLSDKSSGFFFGESGSIRNDGHMGLHTMAHKYLDDYIIEADGKTLNRSDADSIRLLFNRIERFHINEIYESVTLLEEINCLRLQLISKSKREFTFTPLIPGPLNPDSYIIRWNSAKNLMRIAIKEDLYTRDLTYPPYIVLQFPPRTEFKSEEKHTIQSTLQAFQPGRFYFSANHAVIRIYTAVDEDEIDDKNHSLNRNDERYLEKKSARILKLLERAHLQTNNNQFNKAYQWALVSMDQLVVEQLVHGKPIKGIFAGLPWFNNFWGRDTFISLPGALLVTGQLSEAKEVLRSFAEFQEMDSTDSNYGRIPNQATTTDIIYNTADGTPWFVRELWDYYTYSGDIEFIREMYPVIVRSIEGTLRYHTDEHLFLTHDEADTWMDAKTNEGAWSPRGNRAVEVQALWYEQMKVGAKISRLLAVDTNFLSWEKIAEKLKYSFNDKFWNSQQGRLIDHLNDDNSQDIKIRPNQIFALTVTNDPILSSDREISVLKNVVDKLTYRYGVASLWQNDSDFHPYHNYPKYYPKDAAYHNGTVWGWLSGPVITSLSKYGYSDLAYEMLASASFQILDHGAAGTFSELLDAIPRENHIIPNFSGTISQAWSLAEYLRNIHQDILGIRPDVAEHRITIAPGMSDSISTVECRIPFLSDDLFLKMKQIDNRFEIELRHHAGSRTWHIDFRLPKSRTETFVINKTISPGKTLKLRIEAECSTPVLLNGKQTEFRLEKTSVSNQSYPDINFAIPVLNDNLKSIKSPPWPLLEGPIVKRSNETADLIIDASDPEHDDHGPNGRYTYPLNNQFQDGILDITRFQLSSDGDNYYFRLNFRNLTQPGWHPEYGFQLTFAAIAIDQGKTGAGTVGRNANHMLRGDFAYDKIIFIGGGLRLEDSKGNVLAAHLPHDVRYALGDVSKKEISFAIPTELLGRNVRNWRFAILVGAQDDHGGAGIGEFRNVQHSAGGWHGGGGDKKSGNCNIYDELRVNNNH